MTEVVLNRTGVDQVNFNLTTSGNSVASCMLQDLLLDPTLEYLVRVSELNCPTMGLPIFGYNTDGSTTVNRELFRIKLRLTGQTRQLFLRANTPLQPNPAETNPAAGAGSPGFPSNFNTEGAGNQAHFTQASFITDLGKSAHIFSKQQDTFGAVQDGDSNGNVPNINDDPNIGAIGSGTDYLRIRLNADGCVEFIGSSIFWNNFAIQFSNYGKILLGVHEEFLDADNIMAVSRDQYDDYVYTMFTAGDVVPQISGNNQHANFRPILETVRLGGVYPLFRNLDHRYFVSVETDLLVTQAILVVDGKQRIDRSICKVYFPTTCKVLLESEGGILREDVDFQFDTRVGQYSFVKKTEPSRQWTALQTSYDLRFYRFHLYVTYRYLDASGKWLFTKMPYPISVDDSWSLSLEFVSKH